MITILYTYRNRDLLRIKRSLDSLKKQLKQNFEVLFVDYGSEENLAVEVKKLITKYDFVKHEYLFTKHQPWNKCKALNYLIKKLDTDYCFVADIDMIFHPEFTKILEEKCNSERATYFQVGYLSKEENSKKEINYEDCKIKFLSNDEATGMTLFPVNKLKNINGYDEFFHCWGAEDTDIHNRLATNGCEVEFYAEEILLFHQWHPNYRMRQTTYLNEEIQLSGIVGLNHQHLKYNLENGITKVNSGNWGRVLSELEYYELSTMPAVKLSNEVCVVDHFLFVELPQFRSEIFSVCFVEDVFQSSLKYKIKKIIGKKVPKYYSLKEINDKLLLHIISFYHQFPYAYKISDDLKSISFKIKKID